MGVKVKNWVRVIMKKIINKAINFYTTKIFFSTITLLLCAAPAIPQQDNPRLPLHIEILQTPMLSIAGGQRYIVYELHLTSFYPQSLTLQKIEIFPAEDTSKALFEYKDEFLARNLKLIAPATEAEQPRILGYGRRSVLFAWIPLKNNSAVPRAIRHRISITIGNRTDSITMLTPPKAVDRRMPVAASPPLKGAGWLAANAPQPEFVTVHNRLLAPLFGQVRAPQRFATDWIKFGEDGRLFRDDISRNENWYAFGEPVLAVADGIITEVIDSVPDNIPPEVTTPMTAQTVAGNLIILDIGKSRYAVYGHLKPGSIRFRKGQKVKRGEVLAEVGNSGNSTAPHLHFQIADAPHTIAEGIPFIFNAFEHLGAIEKTLEQYEEGSIWRTSPWSGSLRHGDLPLNGTVVRF